MYARISGDFVLGFRVFVGLVGIDSGIARY